MTSFTLLTVLAIALAGGVGAVARLVVGGHIQECSGMSFPIGTAVINVSGSFLLGLVMSSATTSFAPAWVAVIGRMMGREKVLARAWTGIGLQLVGVACVVLSTHALDGEKSAATGTIITPYRTLNKVQSKVVGVRPGMNIIDWPIYKVIT